MSPKMLLLPALLLAGIPLPASAAGNEPGHEVFFWLLDRDESGVIEATEIAAFNTVLFNSLDADGNGTLTAEELRARGEAARGRIADRIATAIRNAPALAERRAEVAARVDAAMPMTREDFLGCPMARVAEADGNGDGAISLEEFLAAPTVPALR